jgi:hypothetical protein
MKKSLVLIFLFSVAFLAKSWAQTEASNAKKDRSERAKTAEHRSDGGAYGGRNKNDGNDHPKKGRVENDRHRKGGVENDRRNSERWEKDNPGKKKGHYKHKHKAKDKMKDGNKDWDEEKTEKRGKRRDDNDQMEERHREREVEETPRPVKREKEPVVTDPSARRRNGAKKSGN